MTTPTGRWAQLAEYSAGSDTNATKKLWRSRSHLRHASHNDSPRQSQRSYATICGGQAVRETWAEELAALYPERNMASAGAAFGLHLEWKGGWGRRAAQGPAPLREQATSAAGDDASTARSATLHRRVHSRLLGVVSIDCHSLIAFSYPRPFG